MIQPQILQYQLDQEEAIAVLPDSSCMKKEVLLLADDYFHFVIWQGLTIKQWIDAGYHQQEEFTNLKELIELPEKDIEEIQEERRYKTKLVRCHFGSPMERLLKAKLNPEKNNQEMSTQINDIEESGNFISDESSLSDFMSKLLTFISK